MANPSVTPKTGRDVTFIFYDVGGVGGANTFAAAGQINGDMSTEHGAKPERIHIIVRGKWKSSRKGNDPIVGGSMSLPLLQFTNGSQDVLLDVIDGTGNIGSTWTKYSSKIEEWNVGMRVIFEGTDHGDGAHHYKDYPGVIFTWGDSEAENSATSVNIAWECPDFDNITTSGPS
jgi:hypothetical protein